MAFKHVHISCGSYTGAFRNCNHRASRLWNDSEVAAGVLFGQSKLGARRGDKHLHRFWRRIGIRSGAGHQRLLAHGLYEPVRLNFIGVV